MRADVHRFSLTDPGDVSGLAAAIAAGRIDPATIVAVIGKTPGNGLVNDYTRGYLTLSLALLIGGATGETPDAVRARVPFVFSGGVEGVLSPHYSVFTVVADAAPAQPGVPALAVGVAFTPELSPSDIGRQAQIDATAAAVDAAMAQAKIATPADVHFVQVKGPAFTLADIVASAAAGRPAATDNPGKLMGFGRAASALGVAGALGEVPAERAVESAVFKDFSLFSAVASISAGVEVRTNEVIVVGLSTAWSGPLTIGHRTMADALDIGAVHALAGSLGFTPGVQIAADEAARIRAAFVKCEAARDGLVRGRPHTMLNDGDIDQQRHIRGAVGAIVASVLNDTALFVSGGAEHQGPDGGGTIAVIAERH
ncbi:ring-opening amidohydrolase [Prosthecomicrobium pneumaticum]|uniref:Cyclic amide hydrolase n=1 Tax=Prosthecomicrobium pneumaticum TaxID=81895 RepID=A0A7W9FLW4_9HYPH|nr:ring-opening amidohydrolase [Prosthecomicrobium pneumaticum]MBB5753072.1 cyanuric acid amidohydrolase [Prosthecomicrobium pneumaticum]